MQCRRHQLRSGLALLGVGYSVTACQYLEAMETTGATAKALVQSGGQVASELSSTKLARSLRVLTKCRSTAVEPSLC